jgi:ATP-dependent Clp protease adaptor protein ClpS
MKFLPHTKINNRKTRTVLSEQEPVEPPAAPAAPNGSQESRESAQESDGPGTAVAEKPAPTPVRPRVDKLPPWKVLLHNDDVNTFEHVVTTIVMLTPLTLQDALDKTIEAHKSGVSLIMTTHKEKAELVQEQFASRQLTVTIEPDGK